MLIYYALKYLLIKSHGVTRQNLRSKNPDWIRTLWQVFFLLPDQNRACSKMKSAQWGFSFKKSNIHF